MVNNKTYNNLIDTLKELGTQHDQITTTTSGDIWEIDLNKNTLFPLMHINPVNVQTGQSTLTYNFQIFIMDLVSNQEVLSDCLQICTDIIGVFRHSQWQSELTNDINAPVYFGEGEFNIEPFSERFDNEVTGWVFPLAVTVHNDFQTCDIPMKVNPIGK
jgi:hypothetical protein